MRKCVAGERDVSFHENWLTMVREATAEGRLFVRVRVVSVPLTDYSRFGLWLSGLTREAGDDIRYLTRDQAEAANVPTHDYWLFDNYWRDVARHHAISRDEFATKYEQRDNER